jgi:hypothetical protein
MTVKLPWFICLVRRLLYDGHLPSSRMRQLSPRYDLYVLLVVQAGFVARRFEAF